LRKEYVIHFIIGFCIKLGPAVLVILSLHQQVKSSKVLFKVGTIKAIKHKLSGAVQTDMHNNNSTKTQ